MTPESLVGKIVRFPSLFGQQLNQEGLVLSVRRTYNDAPGSFSQRYEAIYVRILMRNGQSVEWGFLADEFWERVKLHEA